MKNREKGIFIISLDFELNWGVHDVFTVDQYGENLSGTRKAIDEMLKLFETYKIQATWATVGMLFCNSKKQLLQYLPKEIPTYEKYGLSPYEKWDEIGLDEAEDPLHFGASIVEKIGTYPDQEIATHTFSHYYCLESGQTSQQFDADIKTAVKISCEAKHSVQSIVFPRNQFNKEYLPICKKYGIQSYRGNQTGWIYKECRFNQKSLLKRGLRLLDGYVNLTGHHTYPLEKVTKDSIVNLPASHFLRPYNRRFKKLENLKLQRIKQGISHAANQGEVYHLWWHPHNFGKNIDENMELLGEVLQHVNDLVEKGHLISLNMEKSFEVAYAQEGEEVPEQMYPEPQYEM